MFQINSTKEYDICRAHNAQMHKIISSLKYVKNKCLLNGCLEGVYWTNWGDLGRTVKFYQVTGFVEVASTRQYSQIILAIKLINLLALGTQRQTILLKYWRKMGPV